LIAYENDFEKINLFWSKMMLMLNEFKVFKIVFLNYKTIENNSKID